MRLEFVWWSARGCRERIIRERERSKTRHAVTQKRLINRSIYNPKQAMPFEENTARVYTSHVWSEKTIMENNNEGNW